MKQVFPIALRPIFIFLLFSSTFVFSIKLSAQCGGGNILPTSKVVCSGMSHLFTVLNTNGTLQWQQNLVHPDSTSSWTDITGATSNTYNVTNVTQSIWLKVKSDTAGCVTQYSNVSGVHVAVTPTVVFTNINTNSATVAWTPFGSGDYTVSWTGASTGTAAAASSPFTITGLTPNQSLCVWVTKTSLPSCPGVTSTTICDTTNNCGYDMSFADTLIGNVVSAHVLNPDPNLNYQWHSLPTPGFVVGDSVSYTVSNADDLGLCLKATDTAGYCSMTACHGVVASPSLVDTLRGFVWKDQNSNGLLDTLEGPMNQVSIHWVNVNDTTLQGWESVSTADSGEFELHMLPGTYFVISQTWSTLHVQNYPLSPSGYTVTVTGTQNISSLNFGYLFTGVILHAQVFIDSNSNALFDSTESPLSGYFLKINGINNSVSAQGILNVAKPVGTYDIEFVTPSSAWSLSTPSSYTVNASTAGTSYGPFLFGVSVLPNDLAVEVHPVTAAVPGLVAKYHVHLSNVGYVAASGELAFINNGNFTLDSITIPVSSTSGDTLYWTTPLIQPGSVIVYEIWYHVPTSATLGTSFGSTSWIITNGGDGDTVNNADIHQQNIVMSWDPNDKSVSPPGTGTNGAIDPDNVQTLTYTIRFQNTGTWYATNVILVDTLSPHLDWNSIQMNGASHNYTAQLNDSTGVLTFFFNNIMLPDSNTNEPESHGYAQFEINLDSTLALGTVIENFADIYFDFNEPVRTNTVVNTLEEEIINSLHQPVSHQGVSVYPNPAGDKIYWKIKKPSHSTFVTVYNVLGVAISSVKVDLAGSATLERGNMPSGLYFFEVTAGNSRVDKGTFVWD